MKLAMAAGDKRHRLIAEIMPRHFEQTARKAAVTPALVTAILDELAQSFDSDVHSTLAALPPGFSEELVGSIIGGLRSRARLLERAGTP